MFIFSYLIYETGELFTTNEKIEEYRSSVQSLLQKYPKFWENVEKLDSEKYGPCLRTFSKIGSMHCVLSFNAGVAVATTKLLQHIFKIEPACECLGIDNSVNPI